MTDLIKPPSRLNGTPGNVRVFLAGAIDMGRAEPWQDYVFEWMCDSNFPLTFFNPRREDWDAAWEQTLKSEQFVEQVNWELDNIEKADIVFMYFPSDSLAPISLLEFGLAVGLKKKIIIAAGEGYHRLGNLAVICDREGIVLHPDLQSAISELYRTLY